MNGKVENIKRKELTELGLTEFLQFAEEERLLMNDPFFSLETFNGYAALKEEAENYRS